MNNSQPLCNRILAVDDDPVILKLVTKYLESSFQVITATSGPEALKLLESSGPFFLLIADMVMPEMNGIDLLVRAHRINRMMVRMMLTGNSDRHTTELALSEGGVTQYVVKPFTAADLRSAVERSREMYNLDQKLSVLGS